jgi:hypothetical protein
LRFVYAFFTVISKPRPLVVTQLPDFMFWSPIKAGRLFHEQFERDESRAGGSDRAFGLVFAVASAILGALNYWRGHSAWPWWLIASALLLIVALAAPGILHPFNRVWSRFGLLLQRIVQPLVMALLFFTTMAPMGLLIRAMGKDFLRRKYDPSAASYWIVREPPGPSTDSFKNQF